jgi:hypothetical protein
MTTETTTPAVVDILYVVHIHFEQCIPGALR